MDSNEFNKIAGAVLGAALAFMLLGFFAGRIFFPQGHHEDVLAYALDTGEEDDAGDVAEDVTVDYVALVASADTAAGEKVFSKCKSCQKVEDGAKRVGPSPWGVIGRDIGSIAGFGYSDTLANHGGVWDLAALNGFLENPKGWAPGTKMGFKGLAKPEDRVNVIAWLNEADGTPIELAAAPAEAPADETVAAAADEPTGDTAVATDETPAEAAAIEEAATEEAATEEAVAVTEETTEEQTATATEEAPAEETAATVDEAPADTEVAAVDTEQAVEEAPAETVAPTGAAALLASADASAGKKVFNKCKACHKIAEGAKGVGPSLWGVVGRDIASLDGYKYSDALSGKDGAWTLEKLNTFLSGPKAWAPGTKMSFKGLAKEQDRINVITYLNEADGTPVDLAAE